MNSVPSLKLKEYIDNIDPEINMILKNKGAVISGSTALYFYLKENDIDPGFELSDIDIYMGYKNGYGKLMDLYEKLFKDQPEYVDFGAISCYSGQPFTPCPEELTKSIPKPLTHMIDFVRPCIKNGIKIEFIELSKSMSEKYKDNIPDFINDCIDFNFCKCWWDGEKIFTYYHDDVINKKCELLKLPIIDSMYYKLNISDLFEYQNKIKNNMFDDKDIDHVGIVKRLDKYRKRGFEIDTSKLCLVDSDIICNDIMKYMTKLHYDLKNYNIDLYFNSISCMEKNGFYYKEFKKSNNKNKIYIDIKRII